MRYPDESLLMPINVEASIQSLPGPDALFPTGRDPDERSFYLPFAESLLADPSKLDLLRGLGELGLVAMQPGDFEDAEPPRQYDYAWALLEYARQLKSRGQLLRLDGELDGGMLGALYGVSDKEWAEAYAEELLRLHEIMRRTRVYAHAENLRGDARVQERLKTTVPSYRVEVRHNIRTNGLAIVRVPRAIPRQRQAA